MEWDVPCLLYHKDAEKVFRVLLYLDDESKNYRRKIRMPHIDAVVRKMVSWIMYMNGDVDPVCMNALLATPTLEPLSDEENVTVTKNGKKVLLHDKKITISFKVDPDSWSKMRIRHGMEAEKEEPKKSKKVKAPPTKPSKRAKREEKEEKAPSEKSEKEEKVPSEKRERSEKEEEPKRGKRAKKAPEKKVSKRAPGTSRTDGRVVVAVPDSDSEEDEPKRGKRAKKAPEKKVSKKRTRAPGTSRTDGRVVVAVPDSDSEEDEPPKKVAKPSTRTSPARTTRSTRSTTRSNARSTRSKVSHQAKEDGLFARVSSAVLNFFSPPRQTRSKNRKK